jgi:hypothetical protein
MMAFYGIYLANFGAKFEELGKDIVWSFASKMLLISRNGSKNEEWGKKVAKMNEWERKGEEWPIEKGRSAQIGPK